MYGIFQLFKKMQPLENNLSVKDIKTLLKLFNALNKAIKEKPLHKDKNLEDKSFKEAEEEIKTELIKRQAGFTLPPGRINISINKVSKKAQKIIPINPIIEVKAENIYRTMDKKYDDMLKKREERIQLLLQNIDHVITPLRFYFLNCPEANKTLLIADWPNLRKGILLRDFSKPEMQAQVDRSITALKIIIRKVWWKKFNKIKNEIKDFCISIIKLRK